MKEKIEGGAPSQEQTGNETMPEYEQIGLAIKRAEQEAMDALQGLPKEKILEVAIKFQSEYSEMIRKREIAQRFNPFSVQEELRLVYPGASFPQIAETSSAVANLIREKMGEAMDVTQTDLMAASTRRDVASEELSKKMTAKEVSRLDKIIQEQAAKGEFELPENYNESDEYRAGWLAEWVAKGYLKL